MAQAKKTKNDKVTAFSKMKKWFYQWYEDRVEIGKISTKNFVVVSLSLIVIIATAFSAVYSGFMARQSYNELSSLQHQQDLLQQRWGQLLLEQSALSSHSRLEEIATQELLMRPPLPEEIVMVEAED